MKRRKAERPRPVEATAATTAETSNRTRRGGGRGAATNGRKTPPAFTLIAGRDDLSATRAPLPAELYLNRELSWLAFNCRVLDEAAEAATPLLERAKFAAIFSSNLDEFFMIRVAGVKRKVTAGIGDPGPDGRSPIQQLAAIRGQTQTALDDHARLVTREILPALAAAGVTIVPHAALTGDEQTTLADLFEREIFPVLTPQAVDRGRRFPHVSNLSLNLIVVLRSSAGSRFARVKVPALLPRLVAVPGATTETGLDPGEGLSRPTTFRFTWLEQLIAAHLPRLFPGSQIVASYPFHVVRDSDIEVDDDEDEAADTDDLLALMRESLSQRTFGTVVRLDIDASMPEDVRDWLLEQTHAATRDLYVVDGPLAARSLFELARLDRPDLKDPPLSPAPLVIAPRDTSETELDPESSIFALLRERDILVHHPYQSFSAVSDFVRAASTDPDVVAIKQTLYRIGKDSPLVPALIEARDDDTQVAVLVELKARFDEENNIGWAQELERHGVHVAYGLTGLKTHCKATLVVRRETDGTRRYVHLATGNYNAATARIYEDLGLLTAREDIGSDVTELFNVLTGYAEQDRFRQLWVAPVRLREQFLTAIAREVAIHAKQGGGHLIFKMNALVDREIIAALYAASQAGVRIDLIVRGVCCLRPGVPGWSETIRVISLVGRFLEHSRIYWFGNGGDGADELYLGSADLMERNLDRRVEIVFPVADPAIKTHLRDVVLPAYLRDTFNARELQSDGTWLPRAPEGDEAPFDVQDWLLRLYR